MTVRLAFHPWRSPSCRSRWIAEWLVNGLIKRHRAAEQCRCSPEYEVLYEECDRTKKNLKNYSRVKTYAKMASSCCGSMHSSENTSDLNYVILKRIVKSSSNVDRYGASSCAGLGSNHLTSYREDANRLHCLAVWLNTTFTKSSLQRSISFHGMSKSGISRVKHNVVIWPVSGVSLGK